MRTIRGFFTEISNDTKNLSISGEYYNYFKNVLRLKKNDLVELFNSLDGNQYKTKISNINNKNIDLEVISSKEIKNENSYSINLYQSLIKNENFELVIQKATELGVNNIYPIITEYTNHKFDKKGFDKKLERWNKIAISATEQCGRVFVPKIHAPLNLQDINLNPESLNLTLCPYSKTINNFEIKIKNSHEFNIFIGPEGGFSENEMEYFEKNNFSMINLGKRILKAETAPINIISIINFLKD
ncbi:MULTISPECIES: 16S rRNA (uracil(1498)-N(3))-methyltransferase [unclassified Francisella]|uniref:16S rRNA (uracil(1498)-N(3))-methyltransferase n=1 Tax=unclassified Francisella TaxID=2610885 RepID=UPI002E354EB5|nr:MULTISPECIES: 16S rRNA (uracil(1498)-N(3))-methyltransferase [unclassified Francisella]MED7819253.1 16S rRNA (uracil(1498)-N(3))-methyltransferase [Francisella sp. 19S2-4]MED7830042.1 16S rRNA (uracil(1498)-N(3))-methyltransferase [Francisella sp. 19S2-10]